MTARIDDDNSAIVTLEIVRDGCPALRNVFLPDDLWADFREWHHQPDTIAWHRSKLVLALERGHLGRLTSPIYRYLMDGGTLRRDVRRQYLKDLPEAWMQHSDALERHRRSRRHDGRLAELQVVEWLEGQGWTISGLEVFRVGPDIEAKLKLGIVTAFEVKFIGTEDIDFSKVVHTMSEGPSAYSVSPYVAVNYLLFRAYEAAKQLTRYTARRIAVGVIDELAWSRFQVQLENSWIDWSNPEFIAGEPDWETFMNGQRSRYPDLTTELRHVLGNISKIWILRRAFGYKYKLEYAV
jgi:hypothetical protein